MGTPSERDLVRALARARRPSGTRTRATPQRDPHARDALAGAARVCRPAWDPSARDLVRALARAPRPSGTCTRVCCPDWAPACVQTSDGIRPRATPGRVPT
ncbi:hypothetical protein SSP24_14660 [Streptomyces spinoverrucosus]|uniref:Uncharacterized protein n=1 Tax=Streptomyces spinoverrucosus TaxID=284043 RepID=A0A4Y3VE05_9ACTN|nr:hypothetical protein SSP24_14660 [Streptomyces spinoverrucosus]GHB50015.1 hypothetical protein GCM10010397_20020 [Streptomyces spinoverrucosus]